MADKSGFMKLLCLLWSLLLFSPACKKKRTTLAGNNGPLTEVPGPAIQLDHFPLKTGNMWVYDNGDTLRVTMDTMINGMAAQKLERRNRTNATISYYANNPDGLYLLGTNARPYSLLVPNGGFSYEPMTIFSAPMLIARYPVSFNNEWNTNEPNAPYARRKWMNYVSITNAAGTFNSAKLSTVGGNLTEYYSDKGLVRVILQPQCFAAPCPPMVANLVYVNF